MRPLPIANKWISENVMAQSTSIIMVIARIRSGLGNQLFIYAAARALAHRLGEDLKLDVSFFKTYPLRQFALGHFAIDAKICRPQELWLRKLFAKLHLRRPDRLFREASPAYQPAFAELKNNTILQGYFQSEKYFSSVPDILRKEFALKTPLSGPTSHYLARMSAGNPVSVHVRRGDYVSYQSINERFGALDLDYYSSAKRWMDHELSGPTYHIFSDDGPYAEKYILPIFGPCAQIVPPVTGDFEHLALMRSCHHHIIANSSFSWWGAWLADFPGKQVIAPATWFRNKSEIPVDIIPDNWITIENGFA
jgi:hypothetical protein